MSGAFSLFDALQRHGVERLRFRRKNGRLSMIAALPEEGWQPAEVLLEDAESDLVAAREMIERGGHERVDFVHRAAIGLRFLCAVHDTTRGPGAGGLRRHDPVISEHDVVQDLLNLSRAMTYKNAVGGLGRGGSKLAIHNTELPYHDRDRWLDLLAEEIDLSGTITGPDAGFDPRTYLELAQRTSQLTGTTDGGTGKAAAVGVLAALDATAAALGRGVSELHFVVQGLGTVGHAVAAALAGRGARLTVTDRDPARLDALLGGLEVEARRLVNVVAPYQLLDVVADVLVPCALGGVVTPANVGRWKVQAVCGSANNQLEARDLSDERRLAEQLLARGILFAPDWIVSAGGAIHGIMQFQKRAAFEPKQAEALIRRRCGWALDEVLSAAKRTGQAPLEVALERFGPLR